MHSSVIPNHPVDSTWITLWINSRVIFTVYRLFFIHNLLCTTFPAPYLRIFRFFPNFPRYYYEYYILSFCYV